MPTPDTAGTSGWEALVADDAAAGRRLDAWLAETLAGHLSRSRIRTMIEAHEVLCEGRPATPSHRLVPGERVEWMTRQGEPDVPLPEPVALCVLYEDDHLIVIDKPAGMVVHPGAGNRSGTLVNALLHHCGGGLSEIGGPDRPGIVHRIDKDTSGVLVAAKTDAAHAVLAAAFADHGRSGGLERSYVALVWGRPVPEAGTIRAPLGRASDRVRRAVVPAHQAGARNAVTRYWVREYFDSHAALVECSLETGRTHQIRVHMAHIGHPVIGDPLYGRGFATKARALAEPARALATGFPRQALHAAVLGFRHPVSGVAMRFESPLPADMAALIRALRNN